MKQNDFSYKNQLVPKNSYILKINMEETIMKDAGFWVPLMVIGIFTLIGIIFLGVGIGLRVNESQ